MSDTRPRYNDRRPQRPGLLVPLLLGSGVIFSAIAAIQIKNDNRRLTNESTQLRDEHDRLEVEWSQLQLEEAAHSSHSRIETIARTQLKMVEPRETVMVPGSASATVPAGAAR